MDKYIHITLKDNTCSLNLSNDIHWEEACLAIISTLRSLAHQTVSAAPKEHRSAISEEIADNINFGISNILDELSPKDPDKDLSSKAILLLENKIIEYASTHAITLENALKKLDTDLEVTLTEKENETI